MSEEVEGIEPYNAKIEGSRLALENAARNLGEEASSLADNSEIGDAETGEIAIQDVLDWIKNFQEALIFYREHHPKP